MSAVVALVDLAAAINAEHAGAENHAERAVQHARRAGELLLQAKKTCAHGDWLGWLEKNVTVTPRMAQNYMSLARALPKLDPANAKRVSHLSVRDAVRTISAGATRLARLPSPLREEICKAVESGEHSFAAIARQREAARSEILRRQVPNPIRQLIRTTDSWATASSLMAHFAARIDSGQVPDHSAKALSHRAESLLPSLPEHLDALIPTEIMVEMRARHALMRKELKSRVRDLIRWACERYPQISAPLHRAAKDAPAEPILVARERVWSGGGSSRQLDLRNMGVACEETEHLSRGCRCNDDVPLGCPKSDSFSPKGRACLECDRTLTFGSYSGDGDLCDACASRGAAISEAAPV